jgi:hypothetical protein
MLMPFVVIPAKAGIQIFQRLLDPGSSLRFGRDDGFFLSGLFSTALQAFEFTDKQTLAPP